MEEKKKKRIIAVLLLISCVASAILLLHTTASVKVRLHNFAQADSLVLNDFAKFGISKSQIRSHIVAVDSAFHRKVYSVALPAGLSKTQLHHELYTTLAPYGLKAPARVLFPEKDMRIQLLYQNTVIRSIRLYTDPDLMVQQKPGSILIAFNKMPGKALREQIISFGEPIYLAFKIQSPMQANTIRKQLDLSYPYLLFWLQDEQGNSMLKQASRIFLPKLQHLQEVVPDARLLSFHTLKSNTSENFIRALSKTSLRYIDASDAILLDARLGREAFRQQLEKFERQARLQQNPVAIVSGSDKSVQWLHDELPGLKKAGLKVVPPHAKRFRND